MNSIRSKIREGTDRRLASHHRHDVVADLNPVLRADDPKHYRTSSNRRPVAARAPQQPCRSTATRPESTPPDAAPPRTQLRRRNRRARRPPAPSAGRSATRCSPPPTRTRQHPAPQIVGHRIGPSQHRRAQTDGRDRHNDVQNDQAPPARAVPVPIRPASALRRLPNDNPRRIRRRNADTHRRGLPLTRRRLPTTHRPRRQRRPSRRPASPMGLSVAAPDLIEPRRTRHMTRTPEHAVRHRPHERAHSDAGHVAGSRLAPAPTGRARGRPWQPRVVADLAGRRTDLIDRSPRSRVVGVDHRPPPARRVRLFVDLHNEFDHARDQLSGVMMNPAGRMAPSDPSASSGTGSPSGPGGP